MGWGNGPNLGFFWKTRREFVKNDEPAFHQLAGKGNALPNDRLTLLLGRFATAAKAHQAALEDMDEVRANSHARIIAGLHEAIVREGEAGREGLLALVDGDDKAVAGMAAVYSIRYSPDRCVALLRKLATSEGLMGFRARVALERWAAGDWEEA